MSSYLPTPKSKQPKVQKAPAPKPEPEPLPPAEPPTTPEQPLPARKRGLPEWAKGMLATLLVAFILLVGFGSFSVVRTVIGSGGTNFNPFNPPKVDNNTPLPGVTPTQIPLAGPQYKPWNGVDRVTILVMGLDARDIGPEATSTAARSDTMLVVSLDPVTKVASMLSIPRDLYVDIPGYGFDKINKAYFDGEVYRLQIGGAGLAIQTVENLLGIPIDYYAVVDFNSFTTFVDTIGGINVYVPFDNMIIDPVGPHNTTQLNFGWNHLDGALALGYARARHTANGDFDRAARTQQVILAIRDQILKPDVFASLLLKAPQLWNQASTSIKTNLTMDQIIQLGLIAKDIQPQNIRQGVIDNDQLLAIETINNEDTLIPDLEKVRELRDKVFTSGGVLGYATPPADLTSLAFLENAKIEIVNGAGVTGLAAATKDLPRQPRLYRREHHHRNRHGG